MFTGLNLTELIRLLGAVAVLYSYRCFSSSVILIFSSPSCPIAIPRIPLQSSVSVSSAAQYWPNITAVCSIISWVVFDANVYDGLYVVGKGRLVVFLRELLYDDERVTPITSSESWGFRAPQRCQKIDIYNSTWGNWRGRMGGVLRCVVSLILMLVRRQSSAI